MIEVVYGTNCLVVLSSSQSKSDFRVTCKVQVCAKVTIVRAR
jgi:hypothetical protein